MKRLIFNSLLLSLSFSVEAQTDQDGPNTANKPETRETIEEIVITGEKSAFQLRQEVWRAEQKAYEVFNEYNDERRFEIHCSMQAPTGSRFERQVCKPNFEIEANRLHAQNFLETYRTLLEPYAVAGGGGINTDGSSSASVNTQAIITSQQRAYRQKMRTVAEEHPEFLEAIIRYSELQTRYENAFGPPE